MGKRRSKSILQLLYRTLNQNDLYSQKAISLTMLWLAHNSFDKKEPKKNFFTELCNYFSPLMPQTSTQVSNKRMTIDSKIIFWLDNCNPSSSGDVPARLSTALLRVTYWHDSALRIPYAM